MAEMQFTPGSPYDPSVFDGPTIRKKRDVPEGLWCRCPGCEAMLYRKAVTANRECCPECDYHFRIGAAARIEQLADTETFEELFTDVQPCDPLGFEWLGRNYADYLDDYHGKSGADEGVRTGIAYIRGRRVALGVMNNEFIMGSVGTVIGERLTRLIERATEEGIPLVIVATSGGMRMHEGALSLMQMAKISAALAKFDDAGGLFISLLTDPTTGGTTASFAMLGDVILAEPGALIGFAGGRVIANTIKAELPEGFQRAEFLLDHGFVDMIVPRHDLRSEIAQLIDYLQE